MGGEQNFVGMLDSVFTMPPAFDCSYYGFPIHEIREMQIVNMGNYAHGNQPAQHMVYLYNYAGQPWKTQERVREVMDKLYSPAPDGYCGDEDNGQTSAWYVFSAMGFYPVCPGAGQYVFGSPVFDKVTLTFENGNQLTISANKNSPENVYVDKVTLNGKKFNANYITHKMVMDGGNLAFYMSNTPNKKKGGTKDAYPYSMSNER